MPEGMEGTDQTIRHAPVPAEPARFCRLKVILVRGTSADSRITGH